MTEYQDFERLVGDYGRASAEYAHILSQDLDKRSGAEAALARDHEAEFGMPLDFAELNEHGRGVAANALKDLKIARAKNHFGPNLEAILGDAPEDRLAERAFQMQPVKNTSEDEDHPYNRAVDSHARFQSFMALLAGHEKGKVSDEEIYARAEPEIEKVVREKLSEASNPDNKYLTDEDRDRTLAAMKELARCSGSYSKRIVTDLAAKTKADFEAIIGDEAARADYVRTNLRLVVTQENASDAAMIGLYEITRDNGN